MDTASEQLNARVCGRVQGIGFRMFVRDSAVRLGLGGWVRNGDDGSVIVQAVGPRPMLELLQAALQQGPSMARVERVEVEWSTMPIPVPRFEVRG